jgi:hypothetical protein
MNRLARTSNAIDTGFRAHAPGLFQARQKKRNRTVLRIRRQPRMNRILGAVWEEVTFWNAIVSIFVPFHMTFVLGEMPVECFFNIALREAVPLFTWCEALSRRGSEGNGIAQVWTAPQDEFALRKAISAQKTVLRRL